MLLCRARGVVLDGGCTERWIMDPTAGELPEQSVYVCNCCSRTKNCLVESMLIMTAKSILRSKFCGHAVDEMLVTLLRGARDVGSVLHLSTVYYTARIISMRHQMSCCTRPTMQQ